MLLTAGADRTARLWDTATCKPLGGPFGQGESVTAAFVAAAFSPDGRRILTANGPRACLWEVPQPVAGEPGRVTLWAQVLSGLQMEEAGTFRRLDEAALHLCRQRLEQLGGPPLPPAPPVREFQPGTHIPVPAAQLITPPGRVPR
jgi:hypothetical protein